ncbi:MAG: UDP-N-acetylmuramoyl-tripeptide--D-alanyl-D-alanine ligase [Deltaproteobacteria bacterium]|nr:UDP-N-acetylmuramoyl-tripeptide--D-alanyl-D-alanine ligase [Deltaproteobacteria bacterium]
MAAEWGQITPEEIISPISGVVEFSSASATPEKERVFITGLSTDSRNISPGMLFWALKGERYDGHDFVQTAIQESAAGIVVQKDWWERNSGLFLSDLRIHRSSPALAPAVITVQDTLKALGDLARWWRHKHKARVIGITGSTGKTTTKEMTASILELGDKTLKNRGNFNNLIGLPLTLLQLHEEYRNAILEMGMNHPGEIARLTEIADPDIGLITNIGMAHIEGLGSLEGIVRAKWELAETISQKARIIINGDDELLKQKAASSTGEIITFGLGRENDVIAKNIRNFGEKGFSFEISFQDTSFSIKLPVPGLQNVLNALASASVALCLDEIPGQIAEGLLRFRGIKGRFMIIRLADDIVLIDDTYNANPLSLKAALQSIETMAESNRGRIIIALGEMMELGSETVKAHKEAGKQVAGVHPFHFIAMGEHAFEMAQGAIESDMQKGKKGSIEIVKSHDEMIQSIREKMRAGDLIYLKGSRKAEMDKVVEGLQSKAR